MEARKFMFHRYRAMAHIAVASTLLLSACGLGSDADADSSAVKIGYSGPFSGPLESLAKTNEAGMRIALDEINDKGDVELELEIKDDGLSAEKAVTQARQFISQDNIEVMMGPAVNTPFLASQPIYHQAGLVQFLVGTAATGISDKYPNTWRSFFDGNAEAKLIIERLRDHHQATKIAILAENTGSGLPGVDSLKNAIEDTEGVELTTTQIFPAEKQDLAGYIEDIKDSGAEGIAIWSVGGANTANVVKALATGDVKLPVVGDIGAVFKATPELAGDALSEVNLEAATFGTELYTPGEEPDAAAVALRDEVKERLDADEMPDAFHLALMYYNAIYVIAEVAARTDGDMSPEKVKDALTAGDIETPLGDVYSFSNDDHNGYAPSNLSFARIGPGSYQDGFWERAEGAPGS
jgi:branched-chain amino acid transport system substrate-binding protein